MADYPAVGGHRREFPVPWAAGMGRAPCHRWSVALGKPRGGRLVGGNPDFTDAPAHGDDDARFYDRQQAYVHARAE